MNGGLAVDVTAKFEDSQSELSNFVESGRNEITDSMTNLNSFKLQRRDSREQVNIALKSLDYALNAIEKKREEENKPARTKSQCGIVKN
jgi:ABC-type transporter Mla subunit MlaD